MGEVLDDFDGYCRTAMIPRRIAVGYCRIWQLLLSYTNIAVLL